MTRANQGFSLLAVLVLMFLLSGMLSLAVLAQVRSLRDNQARARALQTRADHITFVPTRIQADGTGKAAGTGVQP